jgi:hypothetical protein
VLHQDGWRTVVSSGSWYGIKSVRDQSVFVLGARGFAALSF